MRDIARVFLQQPSFIHFPAKYLSYFSFPLKTRLSSSLLKKIASLLSSTLASQADLQLHRASSPLILVRWSMKQTPPNPKEKGIKNQNWTKQESESLMNFLAEEARSGRKPEKGFKSCQYNAAARALNKKYGKSFSETHIINHMKTIKRKWKNIQIVKKLSGSSFDDDTCTVILGEEEFKTYIQTHPNYEPYINKPMPYYRDMETICNNEMASGSHTAACNGTNSFSPVSLSSSPEEQINVIGDETEEELREIPHVVQPVVSNRRVNYPASNGSRKRKKREEDEGIYDLVWVC